MNKQLFFICILSMQFVTCHVIYVAGYGPVERLGRSVEGRQGWHEPGVSQHHRGAQSGYWLLRALSRDGHHYHSSRQRGGHFPDCFPGWVFQGSFQQHMCNIKMDRRKFTWGSMSLGNRTSTPHTSGMPFPGYGHRKCSTVLKSVKANLGSKQLLSNHSPFL